MEKEQIRKESEALQEAMQKIRRNLHEHPELGFELEYTKQHVWDRLAEIGCEPKDCGKCGIVTLIGGKKPGKCILLRADMDALPMKEEADVEYASKEEGKMHGCGHDMHAAMLLGAAKILKEHEDELEGTVKLAFQPAEEIFQGSVDMMEAGLLENPKVDAAMMIHVIAGQPMPSGMLMVSGGGVTMASCEQYQITVKGKGGHGSMPHLTVDPITAAAQIHLALQEINARELEGNEYGVFTTGCFQAGNTSNVIPDEAKMWGTIRTIDEDNKIGERIKQRMREICQGIGSALRCETEVTFYDYCPCMTVDEELSKEAVEYLTEIFGQGVLDMAKSSQGKAGGGSEDFAFVSHKVPTVSMFLVAGSSNDGYIYGQHNPKVIFDDSVLCVGAMAHVQMATRWLKEHK